jgi:hypothetical protein
MEMKAQRVDAPRSEVQEADVLEVQEADALHSKNRCTALSVGVYVLVLFCGAVAGGFDSLTFALWQGLDIGKTVTAGAVLGALGSVAVFYLTERIVWRYLY